MKKFLVTIVFFAFSFLNAQESHLISVNNIILPVNNKGYLANVLIDTLEQGYFDGINFLFSGGFFLSGKDGDSIWANAVATASRIEDYQPGKVGSNPTDSLNRLYVVYSVDVPFGDSWQNWRDAVSLGAGFYDGDGDGIYNPVDLNGNGIWDLNEDRPDILGDITVWCVYNDGVPSNLRRFNQVSPKGIEIHQTVFASGFSLTGPIRNIIFVRYRLINTGSTAAVFDSVYFGSWSDPDLGDYEDDMVACDTLLNSGILYNNGSDQLYGVNPPAFFQTLIQGAPVFIPGETFIDNNSNGIFDPGIDTPLDTAYNNKGLFLGSEVIPGAKNIRMSSFMHYIKSHPTQGDPNNHTEARNYMLGKNKFGNYIDPGSWPFGTIQGGVDTSQINPVYMYSGDPVSNSGWINNFATDQRMMINSGPFTMHANEPVDIWAALIVGRGTDHLNSITVGREITGYAHNYYKTNFSLIPVDADVDNEVIPGKYKLHQNYPNPFNPSTKISWQTPVGSHQTIKVFDVLGREVVTLVDEYRDAGYHEVEFNASHLASGIYFYQIKALPIGGQAGEYLQTRKMMIIK